MTLLLINDILLLGKYLARREGGGGVRWVRPNPPPTSPESPLIVAKQIQTKIKVK